MGSCSTRPVTPFFFAMPWPRRWGKLPFRTRERKFVRACASLIVQMRAARKNNFARRPESDSKMSRYTPLPPQNFGGLPEEYSTYETARAVIFPVPLERTATYERGTRNGPSEFLEAGKFPVALGGEHSLTPPLVSATLKKFKDLCVLHIGAHAELSNEYQGNPGSHVCTMRRVVEMCPAVQVGVRSLSEEESKAIPKLRTKIYWAKDIVRAPVKAWIAKVLEDLGPRVYLTVNVDGFDSSIVSATGAPEPGGLDWHQVTSLIRAVADHKKIVAMDVAELSPRPRDHGADFIVAKLIYKTLGYIFCQQ